MNQPELSPGLLSLLPSFSAPLAQQNGTMAADTSVFSNLLTQAAQPQQSAETLLPQLQQLPQGGQPLPLLAGNNDQAVSLAEETILQPDVLVQRIRESLSFRDERPASSSELIDADSVTPETPENMVEIDQADVSEAELLATAAVPQAAVQVTAVSPAKPVFTAVNNGPQPLKPEKGQPGSQAATVALDLSIGEESADEFDAIGIDTETTADLPREKTATQIRGASVQPALNEKITAVPTQGTSFADVQGLTAVPVNRPDSGVAATSAAESLVTEAELQQLDEQQQVTDSRERLEFGRDKEQWTPALSNRLMTMVADNIQQAEIHLDPPELGSMEIKLQVSQEQTSVQVQVQNPLVRDVLEANAQRLRDALEQQGMELAGFDVSQQGQEQHADSGERQQPDWSAEGDAQEAGTEQLASAAQPSANSLLDAYA